MSWDTNGYVTPSPRICQIFNVGMVTSGSYFSSVFCSKYCTTTGSERPTTHWFKFIRFHSGFLSAL